LHQELVLLVGELPLEAHDDYHAEEHEDQREDAPIAEG
jgi:hypothetical protein